METHNDGLPRFNSIFRNQPNYTYFSKVFGDDPFDPLFLALNDIDSAFLEPEQMADKRGFESLILVDPRTKKPMKEYIYDHTTVNIPPIFQSPKRSALNKAQQSAGVRIIKARRDCSELTEDDFFIWHKMQAARIKESQDFAKFLYEYYQTNKEILYAPARRLMDEYKKWFACKCQRLLCKYPAVSYNTHLGLPHVKVCKAVFIEQQADIVQVDILLKKAEEVKWNGNSNDLEFIALKYSLEAFVDEYINSEDLKEDLEDEMKLESIKIMHQEDTQDQRFFIPLETLLFLLTSGDCCDLPMEVVLDIKEHENGEKFIVMDTPLPARHLGWHTHKQVLEQATVALMSINKSDEESFRREVDIETISTTEKYPNFPAPTIEHYMKSCSLKPDKKCKFSLTLCRWQLKATSNDACKHIYTICDTGPEALGTYCVKLEYKPTFGCEIMTKYEVLREWFKLKLLQGTKSNCYRLDINSCEVLLKETQSLSKLEMLLNTIYNVKMPLLLSNLYEFLTLLSTMPKDNYLLRYNPKFQDKLMLCKPSTEITANTIYIHQLLKSDCDELLFMSQPYYLPIADDLCSRLHLCHKIMPCTFAPNDENVGISQYKPQKPLRLVNDKADIIKRAINKRTLVKTRGRPPKEVKRAQKARRRHRHAAERKRLKKDREELERDIFINEQIFGF